MSTKHTPGPWIVDTDAKSRDGHYRIYAKEDAERGLHGAVANTIFQSIDNEELANARLIAAAPELLEALEAWHYAYSECTGTDEARRAAKTKAGDMTRAAIAKATQG